MRREVATLRRALWRNMSGCTCPTSIEVQGKVAPLKAHEVCSPSAVRCKTRINRIVADYNRFGLKVGPVLPGETGLIGNAKTLTMPKRGTKAWREWMNAQATPGWSFDAKRGFVRRKKEKAA
jgi:hypothetical protein